MSTFKTQFNIIMASSIVGAILICTCPGSHPEYNIQQTDQPPERYNYVTHEYQSPEDYQRFQDSIPPKKFHRLDLKVNTHHKVTEDEVIDILDAHQN